MAVIKCKMCGGDIQFTPGATYGICEYCGSTSTIPKAEDEQKLNCYNRANHFRCQCEFDKALSAYEKILEQDNTDAEAHWGAVLSRYGIVYVEDPATKRRIPTCHRVQVASVLADADYQAAVENAPDTESRRLYEAQAAEIRAQQEAEAERLRLAAEKKKKKRITLIVCSAVVLAIALFIVVTTVIIPYVKYKEAIAAVALAIALFIVVTKVIIPYVKYNAALALMNSGEYEEAIIAFEALDGYKDSLEHISECEEDIAYDDAVALMNSGKYEEAYEALIAMDNYKDSAEKAASIYPKVEKIKLRNVKVVDYVYYGTYPQTKAGTDKMGIEWVVLAKEGDKVLLLSRYGLDAQPYNTEYEDITWETCSLRKWLNEDFFNKAFNAEEQKAIATTNVSNAKNQGYSKWNTTGGNDTQDKIFLLSYAEANRYLGDVTDDSYSNKKARVAPTEYADAQGARTSDSYTTAEGKAAGRWWLRSPGYDQNEAAGVDYDGSLDKYDVSHGNRCVRPAFWLNLES